MVKKMDDFNEKNEITENDSETADEAPAEQAVENTEEIPEYRTGETLEESSGIIAEDVSATDVTAEDKTEEVSETADLTAEGKTEGNSAAEEMDDSDKLYIDISWNEDGMEEISDCVFYHSPDTIKKGEPYDLLILFCALFACGCFTVMLISGLNHGFTPSMYVLMGCYVLIAFCCLFKPLHYVLSKAIWDGSFREKCPVNKGIDKKLEICADCYKYKDATGKTVEVPYENIRGIYETDCFLVFHETDDRIYAAELARFSDEDTKQRVYDLISGKVDIKKDDPSEREENDEDVVEGDTDTERSADAENASEGNASEDGEDTDEIIETGDEEDFVEDDEDEEPAEEDGNEVLSEEEKELAELTGSEKPLSEQVSDELSELEEYIKSGK